MISRSNSARLFAVSTGLLVMSWLPFLQLEVVLVSALGDESHHPVGRHEDNPLVVAFPDLGAVLGASEAFPFHVGHLYERRGREDLHCVLDCQHLLLLSKPVIVRAGRLSPADRATSSRFRLC